MSLIWVPPHATRFADVRRMTRNSDVAPFMTRQTKRGEHRLLQIRTRALDGTLRSLFEQWYPRLANDNASGHAQDAAA
jgi:hypothetical protein